MTRFEPTLKLSVRLGIAAAIAAVGGAITVVGYRLKSNDNALLELELAVQRVEREEARRREVQDRLRAKLESAAVFTDLGPLSLSLKLEDTSDQPSLAIQIDKPFGKFWMIESPEPDFVLLVDGVERGRFESHQQRKGELYELRSNINGFVFELQAPVEIADGARLSVEWRTRDARTGEAATVRSNEVRVERGPR